MFYGAGDCFIDGGTGDDSISMDHTDGGYTVSGGAGNDVINSQNAAKGNLYLYVAGDGNDTINGFTANDILQIAGSTYTTQTSGSNVIVKTDTGSINLIGAAGKSINIKGIASTVSGGTPAVSTLPAQRMSDGHYAYQYNGGNGLITSYSSSQKIHFGTTFRGVGFDGNNFQLHSASGTLTVQDCRNKVLEVADGDGRTAGYAYMAGSSQTIDGRGFSAVEVIIGSDNSQDIIFAGDGGSSLWGGAGSVTDIMYGGLGADIFFYGAGDGEDIIQNTNSLDQVMIYSPMEFQSIYMNGGDLVAQSAGNNRLTVKDWSTSAVNNFQLWDGSRYSLQNTGGVISARRIG